MQPSDEQYRYALQALMTDGVIAYPTEAMYGFGCSIFSESAVQKLLNIKERSVEQGLIVIAADFSQIESLLQPISAEYLEKVWATWPGPVSWAWPKTDKVPAYIHGDWYNIVVRLTVHPIARQLCEDFGGPIVSTSANRHGETPCRTAAEVEACFGRVLDYILPGDIGDLNQATPIYDVMTGERLR